MGSNHREIIEYPSGRRAYQGNPRCAVVAGVWQSRGAKEGEWKRDEDPGEDARAVCP